jgi:hypothetical protein
MINVIEEPLDVQVHDPVIPPAALAAHADCVQRRLLGPVAVAVGMEQGFHLRLQIPLHDHLGDPVRDRGNAQGPFLAVGLGDHHPAYRRRKVGPRRHAVPDSIEVVFQLLLEFRNRHAIDARGALIRPDLRPGDLHRPLGNRKRFALSHGFLPLAQLTR